MSVPKYVKSKPNKDRRHNPAPRKEFNRHQDNNDIVNSNVDEILLHENQKISDEKEEHEIFNLIFMITNYIRLKIGVLKTKKKNLNGVSVRLNDNSKMHGLKIRMV